jgi:hypothetical protein
MNGPGGMAIDENAIELFFCEECTLTHEYGYIDDTTPERDDEIGAGLARFEGGTLYMIDGDPHHMKAAPCDCCHAAGEIGDRFPFAFEPATSEANT